MGGEWKPGRKRCMRCDGGGKYARAVMAQTQAKKGTTTSRAPRRMKSTAGMQRRLLLPLQRGSVKARAGWLCPQSGTFVSSRRCALAAFVVSFIASGTLLPRADLRWCFANAAPVGWRQLLSKSGAHRRRALNKEKVPPRSYKRGGRGFAVPSPPSSIVGTF